MFEEEIEKLKNECLLRAVRDMSSAQGPKVVIGGRELVNFSSNDYLGLSSHPALKEAARLAIEIFGAGAGASRLLSGGSTPHAELQEKLSSFKGAEGALLLNSGYSANTGIIPAISGEGDVLFSDELNHASIIDGCRLSRAKTRIFRHGDPEDLRRKLRGAPRAKRKIVLTDAVFSMDGDIAPLCELYALCLENGAVLYIDDAHGTGVTGGGRGTLGHLGIDRKPFVIEMGTLSKALGSFGAYAAGDSGTIKWISNTARPFIYSTALPPSAPAAGKAAIELIEEGRAPVERLWENRNRLSVALRGLGLDTGRSETPIIPIIVKDVGEALALSAKLLKEGIYAPAVRPPTVKEPRIRLSVTAAHTDEDIERLVGALEGA